MERARAQGKHIARPPLVESKQTEIATLYSQGVSMNQISKQLGVAYCTVYNYVQKIRLKTKTLVTWRVEMPRWKKNPFSNHQVKQGH